VWRFWNKNKYRTAVDDTPEAQRVAATSDPHEQVKLVSQQGHEKRNPAIFSQSSKSTAVSTSVPDTASTVNGHLLSAIYVQ
jgi:hypothetical protein